MLAAAGLLVAAAVAMWWFLFTDDGDETYTVRRGSIDVTIQTIGTVESTGATALRTHDAGEVQIVAVSPGDQVVAGDILIQLDPEPFERAVVSATRALEEAEFALQTAQRDAASSPDDENLAFNVVRAARNVDAALLALEDAEDAQRNASISASRDGVVGEITVREGDLVNRNQPVAVIFSRDDFEVLANVDELDLANVERGAEASIRLDAYPAEDIPGTVLNTAPQATVQGGATIFPTTIALNLPPNLDIRPGMNADVTIVTDALDDVLLLPQSSVRTVGERTFVDLVAENGREEREIVVGYRSGADVEVVSGLQEGDIVAIR